MGKRPWGKPSFSPAVIHQVQGPKSKGNNWRYRRSEVRGGDKEKEMPEFSSKQSASSWECVKEGGERGKKSTTKTRGTKSPLSALLTFWALSKHTHLSWSSVPELLWCFCCSVPLNAKLWSLCEGQVECVSLTAMQRTLLIHILLLVLWRSQVISQISLDTSAQIGQKWN